MKFIFQLGSWSRQATLYEDPGSVDPSDTAKSLLHGKLFEKNSSLRSKVDAFRKETVIDAAKKPTEIVQGFARTQIFFQDSVLSMQQANHYCAEAIESMDDLLETAERQKFPV